MTKIKQSIKAFAIMFLLAGTIQSCKKEDLKSKEMMVFFNEGIGEDVNLVTMPLVHTPREVKGNVRIAFPVRSLRATAADVLVTAAVDASLVDAYNTSRGKNFKALPSDAYSFSNANLRIVNGSSVSSDSIVIELRNTNTLTAPEGYLLPVTISDVTGKDKGVGISSTHRTVFINVTYEYNNVEQTDVPITGTLGDRTGWSVTVSNTTSGALGPAMLDGNNSTSWRSSNSSTAAKWLSMDMGTSNTFNSIRLTPNYVSRTENATGITVSTSMDGTNWTVQGKWIGVGPSASSAAASPDFKGINFISPVTARYFRLDITSWTSGSRVGVAEVHIIQ